MNQLHIYNRPSYYILLLKYLTHRSMYSFTTYLEKIFSVFIIKTKQPLKSHSFQYLFIFKS